MIRSQDFEAGKLVLIFYIFIRKKSVVGKTPGKL